MPCSYKDVMYFWADRLPPIVSFRISCTGRPTNPFRVWDVVTWITSWRLKIRFLLLNGSVYWYHIWPAPAKIPASSTSTFTQLEGMIHRFFT